MTEIIDAMPKPQRDGTAAVRAGSPVGGRSDDRCPAKENGTSWGRRPATAARAPSSSKSDGSSSATNAIESLNARYRRAIRARGHFPTEHAALKCLYLATRSLDPQAVEEHDGSCAENQR